MQQHTHGIPRRCLYVVSSALALLSALLLFFVIPSYPVQAGGQHGGSTGPGDVTGTLYTPPPLGNFGGYVWGAVYVDGVPLTGAVVTMTDATGKSITAKTLSVNEIEPYPIYMFGTRPATELSALYGSTVTLTASYPGRSEHPSQTIRLLPQQAGEIAVPFVIGTPPTVYQPPPPPLQDLQPTIPLTNIISSRLLATGSAHTCVVIQGAVKCWGTNGHGELGDGLGWTHGEHYSTSPVNVVGLGAVVKSVVAGNSRTCAVLQSGRVKCWGYGVSDGAAGLAVIPTDVAGLDNAIDVATGQWSSCVLLVDHTARCWGVNRFGQLGNGTTNELSITIQVPVTVLNSDRTPLTNITRLAIGNETACAIVSGGVKCWGHMPKPASTSPLSSTVAIDVLPAGSNAVDISVNNGTCVLFGNQDVMCWNVSLAGPNVDAPTVIAGLKATKISVGISYACALTTQGVVKCWGNTGYSAYGQLGQLATVTSSVPVTITGLPRDITDLATGDYHACARSSAGDVYCWGDNFLGQLGNGFAATRVYTPVNVSVLPGGISKIYAGPNETCAIKTGGQLACWGSNVAGDFQQAPLQSVLTMPVTINGLTVASVALGMPSDITGQYVGVHRCLVTVGGAARCWGYNKFGQLGNGKKMPSTIPVLVTGLSSGVKQIVTGIWHTCALLNSGAVQCWGYGASGTLGNGKLADSTVPTNVVGLAGSVVALAAGRAHTCARLVGGAVRCWGSNGGQSVGWLGVGSTNRVISTPLTVTGLISNVSAIAGGSDFTCAVVNNGAKCWGENTGGRLGIGLPGVNGPAVSSFPTDVIGLTSGVVDIKVGLAHGCALLTNGAVKCWGIAHRGDGEIQAQSYSNAITVTGLTSNVVAIDTHWNHTCALLSNNTARCWGDNDYGQLGDGKASINPLPAPVPAVKPAKWTYMLYLVGDNDLSSYLDNVSRALDALPVSTDLNIVVMFDGKGDNDSYLWATRSGGNYTPGLNRWKLIEAESSMGAPKTLKKFIEWAHDNYPAEHYYLSIANHGRGTTGIGWDTQNGQSGALEKLTPTALHQALSAATLNGAWKIDILHFDACLMALLEMAYQVKDYANYMIASENLTAAFYPYDRYAKVVIDQPTITPIVLAKEIAKLYFDYPYLSINQQPRTISVLDLSQIATVSNAVNNLADDLKANLDNNKVAAITAARKLTQKFDSSPDYDDSKPPVLRYFTITPNDEYLDLYDFAEKVASIAPTAAQALKQALDTSGFIVANYAISGTDNLVSGNLWDLSQSHGVSIFFPPTQAFADYATYTSFTFTSTNHWDEFLAAFTTPPLPGTPIIDPDVPPVLIPTKPVTNHCLDLNPCIWGTVYSNTLTLQDANVTVSTAGQQMDTKTAFVQGSEAYPIYVFSLPTTTVNVGDLLTVQVNYAGVVQQRVVRFAPDAKHHEQRLNITLDTGQPSTPSPTGTPQAPTAQVVLAQAFVSPPSISQGAGTVLFHASAVASDNSDIVTYQWQSNLDGELGSTEAFELPAAHLTMGSHTITVRAINMAGIVSQPATLLLTVNQPATATPTPTPSPSVTPTPIVEVTQTPTGTGTPDYHLFIPFVSR